MSLNLSQIEPDVREHLFRKRKIPRSHLSDHQIYLRKKNSRLRRANAILFEEEKKAFFDWIDNIQQKLKLTNSAFAARIGVTCQTVKLWKRRTGIYPSERSFKQLLLLEREARLEVIDLKFIVRIKQK